VATRVALAVNPTSGRGAGSRAADVVEERLRAGGWDVSRLVGTDAASASSLVRRGVDDGLDAVVAVGGDGMAHLVLQHVAGTGTGFGLVPTGTGNDLARGLGLPVKDPARSAQLLLTAAPRQVDAVRCGDRWYACVLGTGFDAAVNDRANRMPWPRGRRRYDLAVLAELRSYRAQRFLLVLDGVPRQVDAMLVAVGNAASYGGGMRVCPDASLDDGLLDVVVVGEMSKKRFLRLFPRVFKGAHTAAPEVWSGRAREVRLEGDASVYADGEPLGRLPLTATCVPGALRVIGAPPGT
jgi:diacylglycerol kinase (ATP)